MMVGHSRSNPAPESLFVAAMTSLLPMAKKIQVPRSDCHQRNLV